MIPAGVLPRIVDTPVMGTPTKAAYVVLGITMDGTKDILGV